jgi:hypothetical protein
MGVLDKVAGATAPRRTADICLDGALQAEWEIVRAGLDAALDADQANPEFEDSLPNFTAALDETEDLRARVAASQVTFVFESIGWIERLKLQAAHPPRQDVVTDLYRGYNQETYLPELVRKSFVSITDADGDTATEMSDEHWVNLFGAPAVEADPENNIEARPAIKPALNLQQFERLVNAAEKAVDEGTAVPPSARSSRESQDSGTSFEQRSPGTSLPDVSEAGSPDRSTAPTTETATASR